MRGRGPWWCAALLGLVACGSDPATDGDDEGGEEPGPSYAACALNGEPGCVGVECATTPDAEHWAALIEEEIEARGLSDKLVLREVSTNPETDQVLASVVQTVGWFRAWQPINGLRSNVSDAEFRASVSEFIDLWPPFPDELIPHQDVLDAMAECHPDLEYDPCENHFWGFRVADVAVEPGEPACDQPYHEFWIDVGTGEVTCNLNLPPPGCG